MSPLAASLAVPLAEALTTSWEGAFDDDTVITNDTIAALVLAALRANPATLAAVAEALYETMPLDDMTARDDMPRHAAAALDALLGPLEVTRS